MLGGEAWAPSWKLAPTLELNMVSFTFHSGFTRGLLLLDTYSLSSIALSSK